VPNTIARIGSDDRTSGVNDSECSNSNDD
jgi:hypothetical protein